MFTIRALSHAESYAQYLEKEGIGEWIGTAAKAIGLTGEVATQEYRAVCRGEDPRTGEYLRPIHRVDQARQRTIFQEGRTKEIVSIYQARQAYGLVLSSPKTVSIQSIVDPRLLESHEQGIGSMVRELESFNGPLVIAAYQHRTSRSLDPLIHTHLVMGNLRQTEDGWRAVDAIWMYKNKAELTERYERQVLAHAERLGYKVSYPHLEGISDEVFNKFSQRSGEREQAIQQYKKEHGLSEKTELSPRKIAALVYQNRGPKEVLPAEQIREAQIARLSPSEHRQLVTLKEQAAERQAHQEKHRIFLHDHVEWEPETHRQKWSYGEPLDKVKIGPSF